jgi:hypothetical protein
VPATGADRPAGGVAGSGDEPGAVGAPGEAGGVGDRLDCGPGPGAVISPEPTPPDPGAVTVPGGGADPAGGAGRGLLGATAPAGTA